MDVSDQIESQAKAFSKVLQEWLGDDMQTVIDLNSNEDNPNICHSGDYCDSNMAMLAAWVEVTGKTDDDYDIQDDANIKVWNAVWDLAKAEKFYPASEIIPMNEFYQMPAILKAIDAQKRNPFGSKHHRNAHIKILKTAKEHNVSQYFETIEQYDEPYFSSIN